MVSVINTDDHLNKNFFQEKARLAIRCCILALPFTPHNQLNQLPEIAKPNVVNGQIVVAETSKFL